MNDGSDIGWLGLDAQGEGRWSFGLTAPLSRFDAKFYGGTGIAVMTATMEAATERSALWATVQFAGSADVGERIDVRVEILAGGHRTSQVRTTASVGERIVFAGIGASGDPRAGRLSAQFGAMPDLLPPDGARAWRPNVPFPIPMDRPSWLSIAELREAEGSDGYALWARMRDIAPSRATLGFLADMVPSAVARAAGRAAGGTSLDNSMRFGPPPTAEWVLVDFDPYFASEGYAHGGARLWATDGTLLAVASQTAALVLFD
jgi:acyl-CoA thioesterase